MLKVQQEALTRLITALDGMQAQYKIVLPDGTEYGNLRIAPPEEPKRKRQKSPYPIGALQNYFQPFLDGLKPGQAVEIPSNGFRIESLRGAMTAWAGKTWGKNTFISHANKEKGVVEFIKME